MSPTQRKSQSSGRSGAKAKALSKASKRSSAKIDRALRGLKRYAGTLEALQCSTRYLIVIDTPRKENHAYIKGSKAWAEWARKRAVKLALIGRKGQKGDTTAVTRAIPKGSAGGSGGSRYVSKHSLEDMVRTAEGTLSKDALYHLGVAVSKGSQRRQWGNQMPLPDHLVKFRGKGIDLGTKPEGGGKMAHIEVDIWELVSCSGWKDVNSFAGLFDNQPRRFVTFERFLGMSSTQIKASLFPTAHWALIGLILLGCRPGMPSSPLLLLSSSSHLFLSSSLSLPPHLLLSSHGHLHHVVHLTFP